VTAERAHVTRGGPRAAVVLGGLPPGFAALASQILSALADSDPCDEPADLTVFQFYCLVTGALPRAPEPWAGALEQLADLTAEDLQLVRSLSSVQVERLCTLSEGAFSLISLRRTLRCSVAQWQALVDAIAAMPDDDFVRIVAFLEAENKPNSASLHQVVRKLPSSLQSVLRPIIEVKGSCQFRLDLVKKVRGLTERGAWVLARGFDEELARMIMREVLDYPLLRRFQAWDVPLWRCIRSLLAEHSAWVTTYLEDKRLIKELFASRTHAKLDLRDVFPKTTAWLDEQLWDNFEEMLYEEVAGFYPQAAAFSSSVRRQLFENGHIRLEQSHARAVGY
ncbi:MAG: hypothetical protein M3511_10870, partial [Deinococcota bacterium]|nr:hypothetical protein [Deinococcota bacterium]